MIQAGNAAAHMGYTPSPDELKQVVDNLEAILDK